MLQMLLHHCQIKRVNFVLWKISHAASAPDQGRSALDGLEAMNHMVSMMREHVEEESRIHYVITKGGDAPNVVPNFTEGYFMLGTQTLSRSEKCGEESF